MAVADLPLAACGHGLRYVRVFGFLNESGIEIGWDERSLCGVYLRGHRIDLNVHSIGRRRSCSDCGECTHENVIAFSSDYFDIDPRYGTLHDWDNLLHGVHERGMKLMCVQ